MDPKKIEEREATNPVTKWEGRPMKVVGKKYASVSELVRDTSDADVADDFDRHQSERGLVRGLTTLRCMKGLTQEALAERMNCGQSKVSKMELSTDADLRFDDIASYAKALDQSIRVILSPAHADGASHIRFHINCVKHLLDGLVRVAGDDRSIGDGVEAFAIKTMRNFVSMIEESLDSLPHREQKDATAVSVEFEGERGQRLAIDPPKRRAKSKAKAGT